MAAPTRNNLQTLREESNASSYTLASYAPTSGAGRVLVVRAAILRTTDASTTLTATFGGTSMTEAVSMTDTSGGARFYRVAIFYLVSPSTAAADIVITAGTTVQGAIIVAVTLLGVDTSSPLGATDTDSVASATNSTLALTGCAADSLVLAIVESNNAAEPSWAWSTATEDFDLAAGLNNTAEIAGSGGYYAVPSAGNVTLTATRSLSAVRIVGAAAEFKAGVTAYEESISLGRGAGASASARAAAAAALALGRGLTTTPGGPAAAASPLALGRGGAVTAANTLAALESVLVAAARGMAVADALPSGSQTIDVSAGGDDGAESTGGSVVLSTITLDDDSVGDIVGFLFRGLNVPKDASIITSYINVTPTDSGRQSPNVTIRGQGSPANFATTTNNFSGRTMTTASASWLASNIGIDAYKASPSLNSVIQEIVNDAGWTAGGNVAVFLIQNSSSGWFRVAAYEHTTALQAQLVVTWSSGGQQVTESLTLARGLGSDMTPAAAMALAVALARGEGMAASETAGLAAALALGRGLGLTNGDAAAVLQALALGRALGMDAPAAANAAALLALTRAAAVDATGAAAVGGALTLGRGEDVTVGPAAGIAAALTLGRLAGIGAVDGFTILEGIVLTRALGVVTGERYDATAPLLLAVLRGLTATGAAGASAGVTLASGREVSIGHVLAGGEAVALARGLGVGVASGMALWETIALAAGRGVAVADALGYAVTLALGRGAGVGAAEMIAAGETLTLALGSGAAVAAAVGAVESVGLGRALGDDWSAGAALLESIGIGIFRAVGVDEAVNFILVTPRHVFVVDAEGRVRVIDLEERRYQVE